MKRGKKALWSGGYAGGSGEALSKLSVSHPFDRRLAAHDLAGTRAHARGLRRAGLLTAGALARIEKGLKTIAREIGCSVRLSQSTSVSRWLVMPRARTSRGLAPAASSAWRALV